LHDGLKVLIVGGGEGATAREVARYDSVSAITMVDFDEEFVAFCRERLPSWGGGVWDDKRLHVEYDDIRNFLEEMCGHPQDLFDAIIVDLPDTFMLDAGFLRDLAGALAPGGRMAVQAGPISLFHREAVWQRQRALQDATLGIVNLYKTYVPFFQSEWAFLVTGPKGGDEGAERAGELPGALRSLTPGTIGDLFNLPRYLVDRPTGELREP
jgi:spermidine synthase